MAETERVFAVEGPVAFSNSANRATVWKHVYGAQDVTFKLTLATDFNLDGVIDAADYSVWRDTLRRVGAGLPADGDGDGVVGEGDYDMWRAGYGAFSAIPANAAAAPEPAAALSLVIGLLSPLFVRWPRCRSC